MIIKEVISEMEICPRNRPEYSIKTQGVGKMKEWLRDPEKKSKICLIRVLAATMKLEHNGLSEHRLAA